RQDVRAPVSDAPGSDVQDVSIVGPEGVADVAEGGSVRQYDLPVRAGAGDDGAVELRPGEGPPGPAHDPPTAARQVAHVDRFVDRRLEAVDEGETGRRKLAHH